MYSDLMRVNSWNVQADTQLWRYAGILQDKGDRAASWSHVDIQPKFQSCDTVI